MSVKNRDERHSFTVAAYSWPALESHLKGLEQPWALCLTKYSTAGLELEVNLVGRFPPPYRRKPVGFLSEVNLLVRFELSISFVPTPSVVWCSRFHRREELVRLLRFASRICFLNFRRLNNKFPVTTVMDADRADGSSSRCGSCRNRPFKERSVKSLKLKSFAGG